MQFAFYARKNIFGFCPLFPTSKTNIYIYIYLSKSNGKKETFINANILIDLIYYLLFNTFHNYF